MSGLKPVVASFGSFLSGKNIEIRVSIGFNNAFSNSCWDSWWSNWS